MAITIYCSFVWSVTFPLASIYIMSLGSLFLFLANSDSEVPAGLSKDGIPFPCSLSSTTVLSLLKVMTSSFLWTLKSKASVATLFSKGVATVYNCTVQGSLLTGISTVLVYDGLLMVSTKPFPSASVPYTFTLNSPSVAASDVTHNYYLFVKNVYLHLMFLNCHALEGTMKSNSVALSGRGWKIRAKRSFW